MSRFALLTVALLTLAVAAQVGLRVPNALRACSPRWVHAPSASIAGCRSSFCTQLPFPLCSLLAAGWLERACSIG